MPRTTFLYVFAYDVERDSRRAKVAALLEQDCSRVQKSVFEGRLAAGEARKLAGRIEALLGPDDSLRVYAVTAEGLDASLRVGGSPIPEKTGFMLL